MHHPSSLRISAALVAVALSLGTATFAPPAYAQPQDHPISPEARAHFKTGVNLLQDPGGARYEEAYLAFKAAYAASASPRILGNMGLCAMKLERDEEAIQAYDGYLSGVPDIQPSERTQLSNDLATLKAGLVKVSITLNLPGAVINDQRTPVQGGLITNTYGPVKAKTLEFGVHPGIHRLRARLEGYPELVFEFESAPGSKVSHAFVFEKPKPTGPSGPATQRTRPVPTSVLVGGIATVAVAAGGTITGILALGNHSQYQTVNQDGLHVAQATSLRSDGDRLNLITDGLFGTAILGAGVTALLYFTRPSVDAPITTGKIHFDAVPLAGGGAAMFSGRF